MRSSTSSSEPSSVASGPGREAVGLVILIVILLGAIETTSSIWFDRTSQVQRRELSQRAELLSVRDEPLRPSGHIAVLGNSLMLEGFRIEAFASPTVDTVQPTPYFVLATAYYDWYYGLKLLFTEGARPKFVLLGLSPNQLVSNRTRGDYSSRYLFDADDLLEISVKTGMDATTTSGFILAHFSSFYSTRTVTRGFVVGR